MADGLSTYLTLIGTLTNTLQQSDSRTVLVTILLVLIQTLVIGLGYRHLRARRLKKPPVPSLLGRPGTPRPNPQVTSSPAPVPPLCDLASLPVEPPTEPLRTRTSPATVDLPTLRVTRARSVLIASAPASSAAEADETWARRLDDD